MAVNIRFKGIVGTLAQIALDKFQGRLAWASDLARLIWYYDATNYGVMARRDVLETFSQGIQDSTITNGQALVAGPSGRIQSQDAATFRTTIGAQPSDAELTAISGLTSAADRLPYFTGSGTASLATFTAFGRSLVDDADAATALGTMGAVGGRGSGAAGRVMRWNDANTAASDVGLTTTQVSGITTVLTLGDGTIGSFISLGLNSVSSQDGSISWRWANVARWAMTNKATTANWQLRALDVAGVEIDQPIDIANAAGGTITFGGAGASKRPVNLTGALQISGTQRISAAGAATFASLQAGNLTGSGSRPLVADASGNIDDQDAATFRTTIGAAAASNTVTREMIIQPLPITNSAPGVVTVGPSGAMRSFGFDGATQVEELFYHVDLQHDYIAGTDIIPHVHWMPSTTGAGDVVWKWDYQWVETGGTFPAPTTASCPAVAAGGTAWVDKRSQVTVSGSGHTYNSRLLLRLYRDPADAGDTYAADAVLSSVGVHYSANPLQVG